MPSTQYEGLICPTHFMKVGVVVPGIIILNTELNKSTLLRDEMMLIHYLLLIEQNLYSIGIFRTAVVTQYKVKGKEKSQKADF